jgi:hypothetical protein
MSRRCLLLFAALAAAPAARAAAPSKLYVVNAEGGSLIPRGHSKTDFTLTLTGVDAQATWFSDRPQRKTGALTLGELAKAWAELGFVSDPPNAAIQLTAGDAKADTLIVELGKPRYDRARQVLTMRAKARHRQGEHARSARADGGQPHPAALRQREPVHRRRDAGLRGHRPDLQRVHRRDDGPERLLTGATWGTAPTVGDTFDVGFMRQWTTVATGTTTINATVVLRSSSGATIAFSLQRSPGLSILIPGLDPEYVPGALPYNPVIESTPPDQLNPTLMVFIQDWNG